MCQGPPFLEISSPSVIAMPVFLPLFSLRAAPAAVSPPFLLKRKRGQDGSPPQFSSVFLDLNRDLLKLSSNKLFKGSIILSILKVR